MANPIVHFEIMGPDGAALSDFYRSVFGWEPAELDGFADYHLVDGEHVGGVGGAIGGGSKDMPAYLAMYLGVDSVDAHLEQIVAGGGSVVTPKQVIPGVVTFALFRDPAGNLLGLAENETPVG